MSRHPKDLDLDVTLHQYVNQLVVRQDFAYPKYTIVVRSTLHFRSTIF